MDKLIARFTLEEQKPIKAVFKMNVYPDKLSQLENDMNFVKKEDIDLPDLSTLVTEEELEKALETKQPKGDYATKEELEQGLETKQPLGDYVTPDELADGLADKADDSDVVHLANNETITGVKTFNGRVNFLGNSDANAIYLSENTRINVNGTTRTVLGFASGAYLIGHSNYATIIRGQGERPYFGTGTSPSTAKTLALTSDIPDVSNFATKDEIPISTQIITISSSDNITLADNTIYNGGEITSLTIELPSIDSVDFLCEIHFSSGATATTFAYPDSIKWLGDDISSNVFVPIVNKRYTVMLYFDGVSYIGVVKGVE